MTAKPKPPFPTTPIELWLRIAIGLFLLLHFVTALSPRLATWGIDYWSEIPTWAQLLVLVAGLAAWIPGLLDRVAERFANVASRRGWGYFGAGVALAGFLILAEQGYSYGDGYSFRSLFANGQLPALRAQLAFMPLDLIAHWAIYRGLVLPLGGTVDSAYALTSALGGVIALAACVRIAQTLFPESRMARWFLVACAFASGTAAMWFGHVEAYTLVGSCLLWSLSFLIQAPSKRAALFGAWGFGLLAVAFHFLAVAFIPALIVGSLPRKLLERLRGLSRRAQAGLVAAVFVLSAVGGLVIARLKPGILVPFVADAGTTYTAFGIPHLLDILNLALFTGPLGVIGVLVWLYGQATVNQSRESSERRAMITVLGTGTLFLWLFAFWIDPLIGAFRDWDLLGAFGLPFTLWGGAIVADRLAERNRAPNWLAVALFALAHTGCMVFGAHDESKALLRVDRLVREDVHYSRDFYRGERLASWAQLLTEVAHRGDLARDHLWKRAEWQSTDPNAWRNLASLYWQLGQFDTTGYCIEQGLKYRPNDSLLLAQLGFVAVKTNKWEEAVHAFESLAGVARLSPDNLNLWAFAELRLNHDAFADSLLGESIRLRPDQQEAYYYRGTMLDARGDTAGALRDFERAIDPGTGATEDVYARCARLYQAQAHWQDAVRISQLWSGQFPQSPQAAFFLGISYVGMQEFDSANKALLKTIGLSPRSALAHYYLALSFRHVGNAARAKEHALRSAALDSLLSLPYLELVYLAADARDTAAAVAATHQYLLRSPGDSGQPYLKQFMK